ncbi:kazal-type proteinase inhibitor [Plakobranchus ocellatus]|uniref:Kazal-type proteinase inhibitor n=1 Tax=Plakobranchus ocellatus TaxID=259542 RepID=A0AAV4AM63_9GAST|nr:kazal-type proteinase inhibitor [Plakobranchus ocellatus]
MWLLGVVVLACCLLLPSIMAASCDLTPQACTKHYNPVCATFKKTFSNRCVMESELCRLAQDGFHLEEVSGDNSNCCGDTGPLIYSPVCASDGKTYDNLWLMKNAACKNRDYLVEAPPTLCPDFPHIPGWGSA